MNWVRNPVQTVQEKTTHIIIGHILVVKWCPKNDDASLDNSKSSSWNVGTAAEVGG